MQFDNYNYAGDDANNLAWDLIVHGLVNEVHKVLYVHGLIKGFRLIG